MKVPSELYRDSLATLTDLYQLTMAYGYWKNNLHERRSVFHLFFRKNPFKGGFAVAAGLQYVIDFLENFRFRADDLEYLKTLNAPNGTPLFEQNFLNYLGLMKFNCTVHAIPEGTICFPNEPLIRIEGPIIQCQLLETALLNIINFQTLIATKATRVCTAAGGDRVVEFGLRRAQGIDGGLAASRAAYIGGCAATSNVLAGKLFGVPVVGTHAHSWVMSFDSEAEAFDSYAFAMPDNCVFLVDTYDTAKGVDNAIEQSKKLKARGHEMVGIRLDSGDMTELSKKAREKLDTAELYNAKIVASNDLDEYKIAKMKEAGAKIDSWGVGTMLVTAADQPALGGVYKLGAIEGRNGWDYKIKMSNDPEKVTNPGILDVVRYYNPGNKCYVADMLVNGNPPRPDSMTIEGPRGVSFTVGIGTNFVEEQLLKPIFKNGELVYTAPELPQIQELVKSGLAKFNSSIGNGSSYSVGLEKSLYDMKQRMMK